jgi:hypothetical protein
VLAIHGNNNGIPNLRDENFGLVLDFHVRCSENFGVDSLGQSRENVSPGTPDRHTQVERSSNGKDGVQDNVPKVTIQKEESQVGEKHETKKNLGLGFAKAFRYVFVAKTVANRHRLQNTNRVLERQGKEEVGFNQFGGKNTNPETVGHPHAVASQFGKTSSKCLASNVLPGILLHVASEKATKGHDGEEEECCQGDEKLDDTENICDGVVASF